MRTPVSARVCVVLVFIATWAWGAEPSGPVVEMEHLRAENEALREMVKRLSQKNAELRGELQRLKEAIDKAGIDVGALAPVGPPLDERQEPASDKKKDANTLVAEALHQYAAAVASTEQAETTDIQKRQRWLEATKQLDTILRRNCVTITYTLDDVEADSGSNTALLRLASAVIKSSDPLVGNVVFDRFYLIRIQATEREAQRIIKTSSVTLRGWLALNVDLSKPASEQPQLFDVGDMSGYIPVGKPQGMQGMPSLYYYNVPTIMIKNGAVVEVDGVPRKTPEAGYSRKRP